MKKPLLAVLMLLCSAAAAEAQVKSRWRITWSNEKPQVFTCRSPRDLYENYWFFTFTLKNDPELNNEEIIPLIVDTVLYTESGKELQHDWKRVDSGTLKEDLENPKKTEQLKFGRFYANTVNPDAEYKIIEYHAKLGNRSDGIVRESIEAFKKGFTEEPPEQFRGKWKKGDRLYLNPREIREHRFLLPGQSVMGIAIYHDVDPRARVFEAHVSGLVDIIKITAVTEDEWKMEYEPQTLKIRWERVGDEFEIERDVLYRQVKKEYVVKKIGPVAAKDTIDKLVLALAETLRKEKAWKEQGLTPDQVAERRLKDAIDPLDTRVMAMVFRQATDKNLGYDEAKDVVENEKAVWRIHEWWITNRTKLLFNEATSRFEVKEDPLPGTLPEK